MKLLNLLTERANQGLSSSAPDLHPEIHYIRRIRKLGSHLIEFHIDRSDLHYGGLVKRDATSKKSQSSTSSLPAYIPSLSTIYSPTKSNAAPLHIQQLAKILSKEWTLNIRNQFCFYIFL